MKVYEIFHNTSKISPVHPLLQEQLDVLRRECSDFIKMSEGFPIFKALQKRTNFTKLKARIRRNRKERFSAAFNSAVAPKLRQRAIYAHGQILLENKNRENYYILPINGFKFVYNKQIVDSSIYEDVHVSLTDDLFQDLIKQHYTDQNLTEGIVSGAEILFYNIPYCYAVHTSLFDNYGELIDLL